jgi:hypothetical protein
MVVSSSSPLDNKSLQQQEEMGTTISFQLHLGLLTKKIMLAGVGFSHNLNIALENQENGEITQ